MLIYICDDAAEEQKKLKLMLDKYAKEASLNFDYISFSSGKELLESFRNNPAGPDLVFLDIYMSGINGVDVAKALRSKGFNCGIVFTTSSVEHAMASYEVNALYYLQKPYTYEDFLNAMARCKDILADAFNSFTIHVRGKEITLAHKDIVFFETGNHSVILHTMDSEYSFVSSMGKVGDAFADSTNFIPCGRSYLVNSEYINEYEDGALILKDGSFIPVPVREREKMRQALEGIL